MARKQFVSKEVPEKPADRAAEEKQYKKLVADLEKKYGPGTLVKLSGEAKACEHYSTGILSLDDATGIGGLPKGRVVEIYGPESAGKTTVALKCVAETQARGGRCAFIDAEQALNVNFAKILGVDVDELAFMQPNSGENALNVMMELIESGLFSLIVIDSVAALVPEAELSGEMGDITVGAQARLMSKVMRMATPAANKFGTTLIFINQIREKIGTMYGNPETTPGGRALKFTASMRMEVRKKSQSQIKQDGRIVGNGVTVKITKNKVAAPYRTAEFEIMYESGISKESQILIKALDMGLINRAGSWYSYQGDKIGQGAESVKDWMLENPEIARRLENTIYREMGYLVDDDDTDSEVSQEEESAESTEASA